MRYITIFLSTENDCTSLAKYPQQQQCRTCIFRSCRMSRGSIVGATNIWSNPYWRIVNEYNSCCWTAKWKQNDRNTPKDTIRWFSSTASLAPSLKNCEGNARDFRMECITSPALFPRVGPLDYHLIWFMKCSFLTSTSVRVNICNNGWIQW